MRVVTFLASLGLATLFQGTLVLGQTCPGETGADGGCSPCTAGTIPGDDGCTPCPVDTFQQGPVCLACPTGSYAPIGSSQCTAFPSSTRPGPSQLPRALIQIPYNGTDAPSGHCLQRSTDIERCGACLDNDKDDGIDCSLLDHYESVKCVRGQCIYEGVTDTTTLAPQPTAPPTGPLRLQKE